MNVSVFGKGNEPEIMKWKGTGNNGNVRDNVRRKPERSERLHGCQHFIGVQRYFHAAPFAPQDPVFVDQER